MSDDWMSLSHKYVDIIHGEITYNGIEGEVIKSTMFNRLHRVLQSSLAYLTYPSNKVRRYEHSIGVMHLAGNYFFHTICNSSIDNLKRLLNEINVELKSAIETPTGNMTALQNSCISEFRSIYFIKRESPSGLVPSSDLYLNYKPGNLPYEFEFAYFATFEAIRLVGLLHDVGHLPYSHIMEFALKRIIQEFCSEPDDMTRTIMEKYYSDDGTKSKIHEEIGKEIAKKIFTSIVEMESLGKTVKHVFPLFSFYLAQKILLSKESDNNIFSDLHRIVDGVIDCDRMDYCCRDLYCAGISKELPNYDRIFSSVQILYHKSPIGESNPHTDERERCYFAYNSKALQQIDGLLQARLKDFTIINYHHKVHRHELLLELVLSELAKNELDKNCNIPSSFSNDILPFQLLSFWTVLYSIQLSGELPHQAIQLDDEWLNTLLISKYYEFFDETSREKREQYKCEVKWNRMNELLTGQKHYESLFKRASGFSRFDQDFYGVCLAKSHSDETTSDVLSSAVLAIEDSRGHQTIEKERYLFSKLLSRILKNNGALDRTNFYYYANLHFREWLKDEAIQEEYGIIDCLVAANDFNVGIKPSDAESIWFVSSNPDNEPIRFDTLSSIVEILNIQKDLFPPFHIYYLPKYDLDKSQYKTIDEKKLREAIAEQMAQSMEKWASDSLITSHEKSA